MRVPGFVLTMQLTAGVAVAADAPPPKLGAAVVVASPEKLLGAAAGTLALFENLPSGCHWSRREPDGRIVDLHTFPARCVTAQLFWNRDATRALVLLEQEAWVVDLVAAEARSIEVPAPAHLNNAWMEPDGTWVIATYLDVKHGRKTLGARLGITEECDYGKLGVFRSAGDGWKRVGRMEVDCEGRWVGHIEMEDYSAWRPGVVRDPRELPNGLPAPPDTRRRGDTAMAGAEKFPRDVIVIRSDSTTTIPHAIVEFWPAAVQPEWETVAPAKAP